MALTDDATWGSAIDIAQGSVHSSHTVATILPRPSNVGNSAAAPRWIRCRCDREWVVKGLRGSHRSPHDLCQLVADQIIGNLGCKAGFPIPSQCLVNIPQELVNVTPDFQIYDSLELHGSENHPEYSDRISPRTRPPANEDEEYFFGMMAVFYGFLSGADEQYIMSLRNGDHRGLLSVDHGHFLAGGNEWTVSHLDGLPVVQLNLEFYDAPSVNIGSRDQGVADAKELVRSISDEQFAATVGSVPLSWGFSKETLVALGKLMARRRDSI